MRHRKKNNRTPQKLRYSSRLSFECELLPEPLLLFNGDAPALTPKEGLTGPGPAGLGTQTHPREILVGVVGSGHTMEQAREWLDRRRSPIPSPAHKPPRQFPEFPGYNSDLPFRSEIKVLCGWQGKVTDTEITGIVNTQDKTVGFEQTVKVFIEKFQALCEGESPPDVILCAIPDEIVDYCAEASAEFLARSRGAPRTPQEQLFRRLARIELATGQLHLSRKLFSEPEKSTDLIGRNLRRALKAAAMPLGRPIQIATSQLLSGAGEGQDPATKAWNFCVALYYKAGGVPWRIEKFSRDTCFVGISFFRNLGETSPQMYTSLAQVFTGEGDAIVLRGRKFEWRHEWEKTPHLEREDAVNLIALALQEYKKVSGITPRRVVVHKTSAFWAREREAFLEGLSGASVREHDLVNLQRFGLRLFREGQYPPLRGTYCQLGGTNHLLYTLGYIASLGTYPRPYVPEPWELASHYGDTAPRRLFEEMLSLTKMNFNNADMADNEPITIRFARKVGEILSYIPEGQPTQPSYRFYM